MIQHLRRFVKWSASLLDKKWEAWYNTFSFFGGEDMEKIAFVIGLLAVAFFVLSYLQKRRGIILATNLTSRVLYVVQYLLLGAFEGAVLDVLGAASGAVANADERELIKKNKRVIFIGINAVIIVAGILLYQNIFSLFPLVGILLQTDALWLKKEKYIRIVSMLGCPFWFTYNFVSGAYG